MGLDMFLYRVRKPKRGIINSDHVYSRRDQAFFDSSFWFFTLDEISHCKTLVDNSVKTRMLVTTTENDDVICTTATDAYVVILEGIDYQRKGLTEEGWQLIPENCMYCDDKALIRKMTQVGGLSKSFMTRWRDGKTVFFPWW